MRIQGTTTQESLNWYNILWSTVTFSHCFPKSQIYVLGHSLVSDRNMFLKNLIHCIFFLWNESEVSNMYLRLKVICNIPSCKALLIGNKSFNAIMSLLESLCPLTLLLSEARIAVASEGKRKQITTTMRKF